VRRTHFAESGNDGNCDHLSQTPSSVNSQVGLDRSTQSKTALKSNKRSNLIQCLYEAACMSKRTRGRAVPVEWQRRLQSRHQATGNRIVRQLLIHNYSFSKLQHERQV